MSKITLGMYQASQLLTLPTSAHQYLLYLRLLGQPLQGDFTP